MSRTSSTTDHRLLPSRTEEKFTGVCRPAVSAFRHPSERQGRPKAFKGSSISAAADSLTSYTRESTVVSTASTPLFFMAFDWRILRRVLAACGIVAASMAFPSSSARAQGIFEYLTGPLYEPIRGDLPFWLRSLVWNDFRLAVLIFVATPLAIWAWSLVAQKGTQDAVKRIMFGYWQGASLLMFTVYLQIGAQPISFATAAAVQVIIPFTLWWWKDLNQEVAQEQSNLAVVFRLWRLIATGLAVLGAGVQLLSTQAACTLLPTPAAILETPGCAAWLEPPLKFKDIFHPNIPAEQLQVFGHVGTLLFVANFLLYLAVSIPRAGRLARSNKTLSYQVLAKLGFYSS